MANQIICAAIRCKDGTIIRGHRHHDCFRTLWALPTEHRPAFVRSEGSQGFIDARNKYVTREQARVIQDAAGIQSVAEDGYRGTGLFSEDLY